MKHPLVDHLWSKITERSPLGLGAAKAKLEEVEHISKKIADSEGTDVLRNVMDDGMIKLALERCIEFHEGAEHLNHLDLHIYYRYATEAAKKSESIIDDELDYLEL